MVSVTLSMPDDVKAELKRFSWVNWSEVAREELERERRSQEQLEDFNRIVSKSKMTDADAILLGREIKKALHERYKKLYKELR